MGLEFLERNSYFKECSYRDWSLQVFELAGYSPVSVLVGIRTSLPEYILGNRVPGGLGTSAGISLKAAAPPSVSCGWAWLPGQQGKRHRERSSQGLS